MDRFENSILLHQYTNEVKMQSVSHHPGRAVQQWFNVLPGGSICSFDDFAVLFLCHFSSSKWYHPTPLSLFNIKQKSQETSCDYIKWFTRAILEIPLVVAEMKTGPLHRDCVRVTSSVH